MFEYSVGIWDPHTVKDINRVESVQRKVYGFVTSDYGQKSSVTKMLTDLDWPSLQPRSNSFTPCFSRGVKT